MLVLDDLHWADTESLRLLRRVAAQVEEAPVVLVVATRTADADTGAPFYDALAALMRLDPLRLDLTGLDAPALTSWVRARTGVTVTDVVARRLAERTDGNPFFVSELVRMLVSEGALTTLDSPVWETVPAGVRDVVRHRLEQLDDAAAEVTAHAAVVGRTFDVDVVAGSTGLELEQVEQAVETLQVLGLVEDLEPGRYRFSHALVRDAVYERLTATTRSRTHGRVATALEQRAHGEVLEHALELAAHYRQAGPAYARSAWIFAERAALTAAERSAHDDALRGFLEAGRSAGPRHRGLRGRARARPHRSGPRPDRADPTQRRLGPGGGRGPFGDGPRRRGGRRGRTCSPSPRSWCGDGATSTRSTTTRSRCGARSWQRFRTRPSPRRAHLRSALAIELFLKPGADVESAELAEEALREVRLSTADPEARLRVLRCAMSALLHPDLVDRRLELYDEMIELSVLIDEPTSLALVLTTRASDHAELGLLAEARSDVQRAGDIAQRRRLSQNLMITGWCRAILNQIDEDWEGAEQRIRDLEEFQATLLDLRRRHRPVPGRHDARAARPAPRDDRAAGVRRAAPPGPPRPPRPLPRPRRPGRAGAPDPRAVARAAGAGRDYGWVLSGVLRSWLWTALEDQQAIADLRAHLTPYADRLAVGSLAIAFVGSVELTLGELAAAAGEPEVARESPGALPAAPPRAGSGLLGAALAGASGRAAVLSRPSGTSRSLRCRGPSARGGGRPGVPAAAPGGAPGPGALASMSATTSGSPSWASIPKTSESSERGVPVAALLPHPVPLLLGHRARRDRQQALLLGVEVLDEVAVAGRRTARRGGRGSAARRSPRQRGSSVGDLGQQPLDDGVLGLHEVHDRRELVGHPLEQQRPQHPVLGGVVVVQVPADEVEVVGHHPGARGVAGGDGAQQAGRQAQLAAVEGVDHRHDASSVSGGAWGTAWGVGSWGAGRGFMSAPRIGSG